jgi:hypothetical protein
MRHFVDDRYSPLSVLVSISFRNDKAPAGVDAMAHDMAAMIARKADLRSPRQQTVMLATKADLAELGQALALIREDVKILSTTMTSRPDCMLMFSPGLLFAAPKPTWPNAL